MLDPTAVVTSSSLLFFAGSVAALLRNHDKRIETLENNSRVTDMDVAQLKERVKA